MGILFEETLSEQQQPKRKTQLDVIVESLTGEDLQDFITLIGDDTISATAIARVMQKHGHKLHRHAITEYRRGSFRYNKEGSQ
jgi:hypothetical protein